MTGVNPYATPKAVVADAGTGSPAETMREEHIAHEASIQSAGFLFMLGGVVSVIASAGLLIPAVAGPGQSMAGVAAGAGLLALAASTLIVGWGLRALRSWARMPAIALAAVGLLGFPIGTLINGYILWLVASRKGRTILSADYAAIVRETPHIRYRTSIVVWIALGLIVLPLMVLAVTAVWRWVW